VVSLLPALIATTYGWLTITEVDLAAGLVTYSYTLNANPDVAGADTFDDVIVTLTDTNMDMAAGTLSIKILDDAPTARNDIDSVKEDGPLTATGNVITGGETEGDENETDGVPDTLGADGVSITWEGAETGEDEATRVAGVYGTLTVHADGSYSYVLNNTDPLVQGLDDTEELTETFAYTLTDGDGDQDSANLTITIGGTNDGARASPRDIILTPDPAPMQNNFSFLFGATLGATDSDPGAFTYSFADGSDHFTATSGSKSNLFTISGDRLTSATNLGSNVNYTLTLKVTQAGDPASASYLETFHIITGNSNNSPDVLAGGTVDDVLYGANGLDVMFGGDGNDTLFGQADGDLLQGNSGNDTLYGGEGSDALVGGADADILVGEAGADQFVFVTPGDGVDTISDFSAAQGDKITILKLGFGDDFMGSSLAGNQFVSGSASGGSPPVATQSDGQFLYNSSTGELFWDADGTGESNAIKLATLNNQPALTASDFLLI
jgi:VCBS repeat-containing protein